MTIDSTVKDEPGVTAADDERPDLTRGDVKAVFTRLFDEHAGPLRGYLAGRVGAEAADDLVAETFLVALRRRGSYDPERAPIRGWLYGIATNLLRNHVRHEIRGYRATARARYETGQVDPLDIRAAERVDAESGMRLIAGELAALSDDERDVLLLTSWAGLGPAEVAAAVGVTASTVRSRLHRVRQKLRARLAQAHQNAEEPLR
ncbi:RNA polymerase sigma factor [Amycolatopsis sp. CA-230715]|uniref:RNA polymerase sigma factor n=1 Tax=Amycolatopsis sp. CA-230715 TaxID=2745196 RepID=UPI0020B44A7B|nr:RNA polymerase sigma factor [Amycolatopsis sp. CA-230715]